MDEIIRLTNEYELFGVDGTKEVNKILKSNNFYINEVVKDFAKKDRVVIQ